MEKNEGIYTTVSQPNIKSKSISLKPRKALKNEEKFKVLLAKIIPKELILGSARDQGDCFFDALAQCLNSVNNTDVNTDKYLRNECHDFYVKNKHLVDTWNLSEFGGIDNRTNEYYLVQYTVDECEELLYGRSPIWGRPNVEGRILCIQLHLEAICVIEILEDPETKQPVTSFHVANKDTYKSICEEEAQAWLKNPQIPKIVVEQNNLHFVPLLSSFQTTQKSSVTLSIEQSQKNQYLDERFNTDANFILGQEELGKKSSKIGYLTHFESCGRTLIKNLRNFIWEEIPMLAVITGKNGVGKTALLEAISCGIENILNKENRRPLGFKLDFRGGITPQIFDLTSGDSGESLRNISRHSAHIHQNDFIETLEDLKQYILSKHYRLIEDLKFSRLKERYDKVISLLSEETISGFASHSGHAWKYQRYSLEIENHWKNEFGIHISTYASLYNFIRFLLEKENSFSNLNDYLLKKGFKFLISSTSINNKGKFVDLVLQEKIVGNHSSFNVQQLSPGERLELLILLWLYGTNFIKQNDTASILLLDEFDAHLHPSLAKKVIEVIREKLVGEYGVQVIMTTHNPTTVSLVPKENLYIMSNENVDKKAELKKAVSKKQAIQLLTSDFVCVNEPFRLVFVEANNDKLFYQTIRQQLINMEIIKPTKQILFMRHSKNREDSSCDLVRSIVENCVENSTDDDKSLREFIFGIVDGDDKPKPKSSNILALDRYSIENYIYDPVHIYYSVKQKAPNLKSFVEISNIIQNICNKENLVLPQSLKELLECELSNKIKILQIIINCITDKLIEFFQEKINNNDPEFKEPISRLKPKSERLTRLINDKKEIILDRVKVHFIGNITLYYQKFLLKMHGHSLEFIYSKIFPNSIAKDLIFKNDMLIPLEFVKIFDILQGNLLAHNFEKPTKVDENSDDKIKNYKTSIRELEEKIKSQKDAIEKDKKSLTNKNKIIKDKDILIGDKDIIIKEKDDVIIKYQSTWGSHNNLPQLLRAKGIFSKISKSFEYEDKETVINFERRPKNTK